MSNTRRERIVACFQAVAAGDAIGKQTEMLSRADVRRWYPDGIDGFVGTPGDVIPRYVGNRRYEWLIGETTDDTEQTIAVARAIVRDLSVGAVYDRPRAVNHRTVGEELLRCRKSLHPGVSLWTFNQIGDPARVATEGDGCGAAMRVAPIAVLYPCSKLDALVDAVYEASVPTHGGQLAIAAAAAVAAAISAALDGMTADEAFNWAIAAAENAERFRTTSRETTIAAALRAIRSDLSIDGHLDPDYLAQTHFPNRPETIVPLAISLAIATESADRTILLAANTGGDTDSVASTGGAIAAALHPHTLNGAWFDVVRRINAEDVTEFVDHLMR